MEYDYLDKMYELCYPVVEDKLGFDTKYDYKTLYRCYIEDTYKLLFRRLIDNGVQEGITPERLIENAINNEYRYLKEYSKEAILNKIIEDKSYEDLIYYYKIAIDKARLRIKEIDPTININEYNTLHERIEDSFKKLKTFNKEQGKLMELEAINDLEYASGRSDKAGPIVESEK